MIEFRLLGEITLQGEGIDAGILRQPKRLAVLAYLASPVPGTWHRRDTVLAMFWPELDHARARNALRNTLYVLRQHLGDAVLIGRGDEELAVAPDRLRTDVAVLRAALGAGDAATALATWQGELLPGLHCADAVGFEHWLDRERHHLRATVAELGRGHGRALAAEGQRDAAIRVMRQVVAIDREDERALRHLMELLGAEGDHAGALLAFEQYRAHLAREFEASPSAETVALVSRLRHPATLHPAEAPPLPAHGVPTPATQPATPARAPAAMRVGPRLRWPSVAVGVTLVALLTVALRGRTAPRVPELGPSFPVTADPGIQVEPAISSNGRLVAYAAGDMLRLRIMVTRVEGGDPWPLTGDTSGFELVPRWAPDDDALLFLRGGDAYLAPPVGGQARRLVRGGLNEAAVRSASWSPRGDSIAIARGDSLLVFPREGNGFRFVGVGRQIHTCTWSPSGEWIACVSGNWVAMTPGPLFGNRAPSAIVLFPAAGGAPIDVTGNRHEHRSPTWSSDGRRLWLLSDRDGATTEAYVIEPARGGRWSSPRWTRVGLQAEFLSLSRDRLAYSVASRRENVHSLPADTSRLASIRDARAETTGNQIVEVVRLSPDGRWLLFDSNIRGSSDIFRLPVGGGTIERLTDDPRQEFAPDLAPDGRTIAYHRWEGGARRVTLRDIESGRMTDSLPGSADQGVPRWSPDGRYLVYWDHGSEPGSVHMLARDSVGAWRQVWRLPDAQLPAWRPDGAVLGLVNADGSVHQIAADSGPRRVLHSPRPGTDDPIVTFIAWDPKRPLLWMLGHDQRGRSGIWVMPARGGPPRKAVDLDDPSGRTNGPTLATDGQRLYFTVDEHLSNIRWAILRER